MLNKIYCKQSTLANLWEQLTNISMLFNNKTIPAFYKNKIKFDIVITDREFTIKPINFSLSLTVRVGCNVQRQWRLFYPSPLTCHNGNGVTTHFALQIISRAVCTVPVVYMSTQPGLIGR